MKIFRQILDDFAIYGIGPYHHPFNWRNLVAFFLFACAIISNGMHMLCEAETFQEYAESIFFSTALVATLICFIYNVSVMKRLYGHIDEAGELIDASKYLFIFCKFPGSGFESANLELISV